MSRHIPSVQSAAQAADLPYRDFHERAVAPVRSAALAPGLKILMTAALIAFGAMHVIGGAMLYVASNATSHHTLDAD